MDVATILGLISGIGIVAFAAMSGTAPDKFINMPGLAIVVGGTAAAILIKFPAKACAKALGAAIRAAFVDKSEDPGDLILEANRLASIARKHGPLALDGVPIENDFLAKGVQLYIDGHPSEFIQEVCTREIELSIERFELGERIFRAMGEAAPAFGLIGTLVGLVQMLTNLKNADALGPAMAVALLTTLYGALIANLIANPIADKLEMRATQRRNLMKLIIDGLMSIKAGLNPRVMDELLETYVPPSQRAEIAERVEQELHAANG